MIKQIKLGNCFFWNMTPCSDEIDNENNKLQSSYSKFTLGLSVFYFAFCFLLVNN
jgi:hypothetical protein